MLVVLGLVAALSPRGTLHGTFVDRKGLRATLMVGGSVLLLITSLAFGLTNIAPWLLVPLFGIAFSLVPAAMWPAVAPKSGFAIATFPRHFSVVSSCSERGTSEGCSNLVL